MSKEKEEKKKNKKWLYVVIAIIVIALILLLLKFCGNKKYKITLHNGADGTVTVTTSCGQTKTVKIVAIIT